MSIGLFAGRSAPTEKVAESYSMVRELIAEFRRQFGSINCRDLTGCDLGTEEGQKFFKENNIKKKCRAFTEEATRLSLSLAKAKR